MIVLLVSIADYSKTLWQAALLLDFLTWNYKKYHAYHIYPPWEESFCAN
jgi:hypothetical protein